jgi:hypothetical protein
MVVSTNSEAGVACTLRVHGAAMKSAAVSMSPVTAYSAADAAGNYPAAPSRNLLILGQDPVLATHSDEAKSEFVVHPLYKPADSTPADLKDPPATTPVNTTLQ